MKLIIPAGGTGTRLRPHTHTIPKTLIHVAGKPILEHLIEPLIDHLTELIFIVGNKGEILENYVRKNFDLPSHFAIQKAPEGLGQAISLAKNFVDGEPILITLDDGILDVEPIEIVESEHSLIGVKVVEDTRGFGIVEVGDDGETITRLHEKPEIPPTNLAIAGMYFIKNSDLLFSCLDEMIANDLRGAKNEFQLTDALQMMLERGETMKAFEIDWIDAGKVHALIEANRQLLKMKPQSQKDRKHKNSVTVPPVFIAESAEIENSVIGPHVSIGENCEISNSMIRDSVVNSHSTIRSSHLENSIIGDFSEITGNFKTINVGPHSTVKI